MVERKHVEEIHLRRGDIDLRLIINHSHGHLRFMDYRVGSYQEKREALDDVARRFKLRKVFTLVEKQDSHNWRSVGFVREGVYPAFFRTADAYTMSRLYDESGEALPVSGPLRPGNDEQISFPGRRLKKPDGLRLEIVEDARSRTTLLTGLDGDLRALPFGRVTAPDIVVHARTRKQEGWVCAEINDSFGHAALGFAPTPASDAELTISAYAAQSIIGALDDRGVSNLFGLSPVNDRWSNELFAGLGFRVSGRLADHLRNDGGYVTTLIWHRRLSTRAPHEPAAD
jgi:hypothetical protein